MIEIFEGAHQKNNANGRGSGQSFLAGPCYGVYPFLK